MVFFDWVNGEHRIEYVHCSYLIVSTIMDVMYAE